MIIRKMFLKIIIVVFALFCIEINAKEYGCTYDLSKGCLEGYETEKGKITISIDPDSKKVPVPLYKNSKIIIHNYNQKSNKIWPLKNGDKLISAQEYYKTNGCPPYFAIAEDVEVNGYFLSENRGLVRDYSDCIFPSVKVEYDDNLNKKEELYDCIIYSSDPNHSDVEIGVNINYTKKTIDFSGATPDFETEEELEEYKKNFDFSKKKYCPVDDFKICSVQDDIYFIYPKNYKKTKGYCSNLDSSEKIEVGDTFCKGLKDIIEYQNISNEEKRQKVSSFCNTITKNNDYDPDEYSCINMCLNTYDVLKNNNIIDDPKISEDDSPCRLSDRLISWIANIIKWLKYIVPVIVIIFGILDFIKAMSADKDDEMKKAQSKFIKRLIAAALIFLIPLIIGFILEQLGFEVTGCGIIKELD